MCESLDEVLSFERRKDPLSALGIGQIQLIKDWLEEYDITGYTIKDDLSIDVKKNDVILSYKDLDKFPSFIKFNHISEDFYCDHNCLTSLKGCPVSVGGSFFCDHNYLTSLEGCPTKISGYFYCSDNNVIFNVKDVRKLCKVKEHIYV